MAGKVIAVDLDEAAHALKLLAEYLPGGGGLVCRLGVLGTNEGVTANFYARLEAVERNLSKVMLDISANVQNQHVAIAEAVKSLVEADASLAGSANDLMAQIDLMAAAAVPMAAEVGSTKRAASGR